MMDFRKNNKTALFIREVFRDNEEIVMKLEEKDIETMVDLLAKDQHYEFWIALESVVQVAEFPIKRNQNLVVKYLLQHRARTILYSDKQDREFRLGKFFFFLSLFL